MYNKQQDIQGQIEEGPEHNYSLKYKQIIAERKRLLGGNNKKDPLP
jgi:hypothetical protein